MRIRKPSDEERRQWHAEFETASRWSVEARIRRGFVKKYRPVLDDGPSRSFDTMEEYRQWCEANLPKSLGYHRVKEDSNDSSNKQPT